MSSEDPKTRTVTKPQARVVAPAPDPDTTVIRPRAAVPPAAPSPASVAAAENGNMLPIGTYLAEFELTEVIGEGGFGIVYLARDHSLHRRVALKEYMPSSLAARVGGTNVSVKSERHRETFEAGLKSFVNEARMLAQFDHASLVKVYRFWEANGTAYMVMPFYEGVTLKQHLRDMGAPPNEAWLMQLLEPLTEALSVIHTEQCYHRDIAPDNVILLKGSKRPLLLDFGAARRVIGDMTQALTVILKPGYAPVEQYAEVPGMKQGGWTDVYALAAVVYYAIQGRTPPTSVARLMNDSYVPLAQAAAGRYSPEFLAAIDRALAVRPEDRTQSIDALREALGFGPAAHRSEGGERDERTVLKAGPSANAAARGAAAPARAAQPAAEPSVWAQRRVWLIGGGVIAAAVLATVVFDQMGSGGKAGQGGGDAAAGAASAVVAGANNPPAATPGVTVAPGTNGGTAAPAVNAPPVGDPNRPFDLAHEFERIAAAQTSDFGLVAKTTQPTFRIDRDVMAFDIKSARDGYLYLFLYGTDGTLIQLFPNAVTVENRIRAGQTMRLPQGWDLKAGGPAGTDHFMALVSKDPRDFSAAGFKQSIGFQQIGKDDAAAAARQSAGAASVFAGKPTCAPGCQDDYGAVLFTAEEVN